MRSGELAGTTLMGVMGLAWGTTYAAHLRHCVLLVQTTGGLRTTLTTGQRRWPAHPCKPSLRRNSSFGLT